MNIYHACGYPLLMESLKQGSQFITEFFDPQSKDHAQKVTQCPYCQQPLGKSIAWEPAVLTTMGLTPAQIF